MVSQLIQHIIYTLLQSGDCASGFHINTISVCLSYIVHNAEQEGLFIIGVQVYLQEYGFL